MAKQTISIVAEDILQRGRIRRISLRQGFEVNEFGPLSQAIRSLQSLITDLIILVPSLKETDHGLEAVREVRRHDQRLPIILISSRNPLELAENLEIGGLEYVKLPFLTDELLASIDRSLSTAPVGKDGKVSETEPDIVSEGQMILGHSLPAIKIINILKKIAAADCTALITGETGTGKELAAKFLHQHSKRALKPLVVINCAAIPDTLLESELFGHEKGAFTGALSKREGAILSANGGTVFFDEIGDMTPYAQAKLLRTIENKEIWPVGGKRNIPVDIRFIAATNRDLEQLMKEGKFRADLYFRLNVARVQLPPLRERKGDIPLLLDHFCKTFNRQFCSTVKGLTEEAAAALMNYQWPGNIRELKNLLESSFIEADQMITLENFPESFQRRLLENDGQNQDERARLIAALFKANWNKAKAAQELKWSRMTLYRKMSKYGVQSASNVEGEPVLLQKDNHFIQ